MISSLKMVSASVVLKRRKFVLLVAAVTAAVIAEAPRKEERETKSRPSALAGLSITQVRLHV